MYQDRKVLIDKLRSGVRPMPYRKIGEMLGISGERVRQIEIGYVNANRSRDPLTHKTMTRKKLLAMGFPADQRNTIKAGGRDYAREWVRIRDKHTCQICLKVWVPGTRRFDVHHTDESLEGKSNVRGASASDKLNMDKMITLCHKCHLNLDSVRRKMGSKLGKTTLDV